jgi:Osmosensitive K+ channel His kinase sensor domain
VVSEPAGARTEAKRGKLRVYLGAAPGVGKTFAMLNEGHRRHERGRDVVVGVVETHGRKRTVEQIGDAMTGCTMPALTTTCPPADRAGHGMPLPPRRPVGRVREDAALDAAPVAGAASASVVGYPAAWTGAVRR